MIKKREVKSIFIIEGICDKCGGHMVSTGECLTSIPAQYPYECEHCSHREIYYDYNRPGKIEYEFYPIQEPSLMERTINLFKNEDKPVRLIRKQDIDTIKNCPHCNAILDSEVIKDPLGNPHIIYSCPNECKLSYQEENEFLLNNRKEIFSYEQIKELPINV